jgi:uncharacterized membrane protein YccC
MAPALRAAGPPLLFGLRLWTSVCLAIYVAFWLELDNAYWAGTSAALMCQPHLGASLRKGWFRMIGTIVGAVAIVLLTACFPQNRLLFLTGLAIWGGACAFTATLLRNFAAYSAALAGYTAAIIASDQLGATGGVNGQAFMLAVARVSEICIGIVCAGIILAGTDFGGAPRRLATLFADLAAGITARLIRTLALAEPEPPSVRLVRRDFIRSVIALDPVIDETIGESSQIRYNSPALHSAVDGLFTALSGWRALANHLSRRSSGEAHAEAAAVLELLPPALRSLPERADPVRWMADPSALVRLCEATGNELIASPAATPSSRLLADNAAEALGGVADALNGLALLVGQPTRAVRRRRGITFPRVPDWLPAGVNAGRAFVTIAAVALFWIVSAWPNGAGAITWTAITVILFSPRADQAYAAASAFTIGNALAAVLAAIAAFAVLPQVHTFAGFSLAIGMFLVPAGALVAQPWQTALFIPIAAQFLPLLAPANQENYDPAQYYNAAMALVAGCIVGTASFRLVPPLSPTWHARRLLTLTLRDLRRLARGHAAFHWRGHVHGRLSALPPQATPLQHAQLLATLSAGIEIMRLRHGARRLGLASGLDAAFAAIAQGDSVSARAHLARFDAALAALPASEQAAQTVLRLRGCVLVLSEVLTQHASYFDAGLVQ